MRGHTPTASRGESRSISPYRIAASSGGTLGTGYTLVIPHADASSDAPSMHFPAASPSVRSFVPEEEMHLGEIQFSLEPQKRRHGRARPYRHREGALGGDCRHRKLVDARLDEMRDRIVVFQDVHATTVGKNDETMHMRE